MGFPRRWQGAAVLALAVLLIALSGCGSDDSERDQASAPPPIAEPADFPDPAGKTLAELRQELEAGPMLAPSVNTEYLERGKNRFGFGLIDPANKQIAESPAVVYYASADGGPAKGPYPARWESIDVKPGFRSENTSADPDSAKGLYVTSLTFRRAGDYEILGVVKLDERLVATEPIPARAVPRSPVPGVGDRAIKVSTPTVKDVSDIREIETRVPPDTMHEQDFADVLGKKPVVLLFSTPALCQSRVCGPVTDVAEQVKANTKDVVFIHMEIFENNRVEDGYREQVTRWRLTSEPFLFAISKDGKVAARLEGAFSPRELQEAVAAARSG